MFFTRSLPLLYGMAMGHVWDIMYGPLWTRPDLWHCTGVCNLFLIWLFIPTRTLLFLYRLCAGNVQVMFIFLAEISLVVSSLPVLYKGLDTVLALGRAFLKILVPLRALTHACYTCTCLSFQPGILTRKRVKKKR